MIKFLSTWIQGIAIAVILASIFEMIIPKGNIKKYVKIILGIYVVLAIVSPFAKAKNLYSTNVSQAINDFTENMTSSNYSKEKISSEKNLDKIYKNTFEKEIVKTIENEGFSVYRCNVKGVFDAEKDNAGISKIDIVLESSKINKKLPSVAKDETRSNNLKERQGLENANESYNLSTLKEETDITINSVNEIEKVEINVGGRANSMEDNKVNAKDIDTLRKFLSKRYEIEKNVIQINIR